MKRSTTTPEPELGEAADSGDDLDFARDLPTTAEDIAALRRLREPTGESLLPRINELYAPEIFGPHPPRTKTSEGWEPFTL